MSKIGIRLLSSLIATESISSLIKLPLGEHLFMGSELVLFNYTMKHVKQYGKMPAKSTIEEELGDILTPTEEPPEFYMQELTSRYLHTQIKSLVMQASDHLKAENPDAALQLLLSEMADLHLKSIGKTIIDFRDIAEVIFTEYAAQQAGDVSYMPFGWPYLDKLAGGMREGDFVSIVGRPMCLSGDTPIWVSRKKCSSGRTYSLKELHHRFHGGGIPCGKGNARHWDNAIQTQINSLGDDGLTLLNRVNDVVYSGKKTTYTVTTANGKSLRATMEHQFLTPTGYKELKHIAVGGSVICRSSNPVKKPPVKRTTPELTTKLPHSPYRTRVVAGIEYHRVPWARLVYDASLNALPVEEFITSLKENHEHGFVFSDPHWHIHHKDKDRLNYVLSNLELLSPTAHKELHHKDRNLRNHFGRYSVSPCEVVSIEVYGEEDTYDICMNHPHNNFVAQDFVVHNSGKTFLELYSALNLWKKGHRPLVVSMEMVKLLIAQRLAAIYSHTKLTHILKAAVSEQPFKLMQKILKGAKKKENPMWIVDGNMTTSVQDIIMLCRQLHPTAVYVDGAYLVRSTNGKLSKWDRMSENAEDMKKTIATDLGIPVVASYQFSKDAAKMAKKTSKGGEGNTPGLEDIYGSDAIAQLSSVCLGLFDIEGQVETLNQRNVHILKGRNGEAGQFRINWDFGHAMDFSEVVPKDIEQLQWIG